MIGIVMRPKILVSVDHFMPHFILIQGFDGFEEVKAFSTPTSHVKS